jgi:serine/threonine-protein kinase
VKVAPSADIELTPLREGLLFAGRYSIVRRIGSGGMGAVYEVVHKDTRRKRALKVLLPVLVSDPDARARFAQEATITADIESEHIIETFDAGIDPHTGCPFIVMELLRGESLGARLAEGRRLGAPHVVELLRQVARALEKTHGAGIIHRDLKPDNLFLCAREDGRVCIKVLDFGIAKIVQQASKSRNTVNIGTPLYMAPEQLDGGRLDRTADLYSLGHIAFELLTGESYWEPELRRAPNTLALLKCMEGPLPEAPSIRAARLGVAVGPGFDAWFTRATARAPADRFQRAVELVEGFTAAIGVGVAALSMAAPISVRPSPPDVTIARVEESPAGAAASMSDETTRDTPTRRRNDAPPRAAPTLRSEDAPVIAALAPPRLPAAVWVLLAVSVAAISAMAVLLVWPGASRSSEPPRSSPAAVAPATSLPAQPAEPTSRDVTPATSASAAPKTEKTAASGPSASATPRAPGRPRPTSSAGEDCRRRPERCRW